jgi:DNA-3-methyladenine glycosylase II
VIAQNQPGTQFVERRREMRAARARWENEGGALERETPTDRCRGTFSIDPTPPFRLDLSVWALRRRPGNLIDAWDGISYRRALTFLDRSVGVCVTRANDREAPSLAVAALTSEYVGHKADEEVRAALERMLGLTVDLSTFYRMAASDHLIGPLAKRFRGLKPPRFPTVFEALLNAVACQQLSLESGLALLNRLAAAYAEVVPIEGSSHHAFPRPHDLARVEPPALRELGFSRRKAETVIEISRAEVAGHVDLEGLESLADDEVVSQLTRLNGIGRWSAEYVLLRGLGRLHVFPGDDVGARNNLARWLGVEPPLDYAAVGQAVSRWQPYAGLIYFHLLLDRLEATGKLDPEQAVLTSATDGLARGRQLPVADHRKDS